MSKVCEVCGKGVSFGKKYARRGLARAKGGAGQKITGKTPRSFSPNIQKIRALNKNGGVQRMRVCTECIKVGRVTKAVNVGKRDLSAKTA
ncbi:MAG: 50S ribosomal protein L28 [Planctomycetota bacterium]|jgi:large subunit ribosomal protein L28